MNRRLGASNGDTAKALTPPAVVHEVSAPATSWDPYLDSQDTAGVDMAPAILEAVDEAPVRR